MSAAHSLQHPFNMSLTLHSLFQPSCMWINGADAQLFFWELSAWEFSFLSLVVFKRDTASGPPRLIPTSLGKSWTTAQSLKLSWPAPTSSSPYSPSAGARYPGRIRPRSSLTVSAPKPCLLPLPSTGHLTVRSPSPFPRSSTRLTGACTWSLALSTSLLWSKSSLPSQKLRTLRSKRWKSYSRASHGVGADPRSPRSRTLSSRSRAEWWRSPCLW